ncbi:hypothetical protein OC835_004306 [Tilletia horrida]|nr:hypothetical protein OC835_004306 [Tilletia horrida]
MSVHSMAKKLKANERASSHGKTPPAAKKTSSSTQRSVRSAGPRCWKSEYPELWQEAADSIDAVVEHVVQITRQSPQQIRSSLMLESRKRRQGNSWNLLQRHIRLVAKDYDLPTYEKDDKAQSYNQYVNGVLKPKYHALTTDQKATLETRLKQLGAASASLASTTVADSVKTLRQEGRWLMDKAIDLENNHAIALVAFAFHPHPNAEPVVVATEYALKSWKEAMSKVLSTDGPGEMVTRIDSEVKTCRPSSYLSPGQPQTLAPSSDPRHPPGLAPVILALQRNETGDPGHRSTTNVHAPNGSSPPPSASRYDDPHAFRHGSDVARRLCHELPASHATRVPHVARQLRTLLSFSILEYDQDAADEFETRYTRWGDMTQSYTALPYANLFSALSTLGFAIDGWPLAASALLVDAVTCPSTSDNMVVIQGGLLATDHWTERHVVAIATAIASGSLIVCDLDPSPSAI